MFDDIVRDIKNLQIQSAINIAKKGLDAIYDRTKELETSGYGKESLDPSIDTLISVRPTEPALRNIVRLYYKSLQNDLMNAEEVYESLRTYVSDISAKVKDYASNVIQDGMMVFTHCHSSFVVESIIEAKHKGKKFEVYNTETRPKFQGRITAKELAQNGIMVHHMVDSAAYQILRKADLFLFGADAINSYGNVYNKVGTKMFSEIANKYDVKTFCVTPSLKFAHETLFGKEEVIEQRMASEVWEYMDDHIIIFNPAFDEVEKENIDGIISELGVLSPDVFVESVKEKYR